MADEGQIIRGIDWRETFPFTHIFRSFRIAVHLSKLALGLALLLSVYFGGRVLDWAWPTRARAVVNEVSQYQLIADGKDQTPLSAWREQVQKATDQAYADKLISFGILKKFNGETDDAFNARALDEARSAQHMGDVKDRIKKNRDDTAADARKHYDDLVKSAKNDEERATLLRDRNAAIVDAYNSAGTQLDDVNAIKGIGLFAAFFEYEIRQVTGVVFDGVLRNNWVDTSGVKDHIYNFFAVGPIWLIWNHTVFFIVFAILFLLAWALFGGAISRIPR
jgi:hypothetical protein